MVSVLLFLLKGIEMQKFKANIMDGQTMLRCLMRMSHEIVEKNKGAADIVLVGIKSRGEPIAERIRDNIEKIEGVRVDCGFIDIDFYRDDITGESVAKRCCELGFSIVDKKVILVDDVIFTGRTVRAAIEAIFSMGRPRAIQLAILVDRGHRELPFRADFVGKAVATSKKEIIKVRIPPKDDSLGVDLYEKCEE